MRKLLTLWIALAAVAVASVPASAQGFNGGGFNIGLGPFASGGGAVTWAFKGSNPNFSGSGTSSTFSSWAVGATSATDIVVLIVEADAGIPTSVTMTDAVGTARSLTQVVSDNSGVAQLSMWYLSGFALGSTTNVVVNAPGGSLFNCGISAGVISGSATPTPSTSAHTAASFADPTSVSAIVPSGGIGIAVLGVGISASGSWSNATQDAAFNRDSVTSGTHYDYIAHTALGTGASIAPTYTGMGGNQNHMIMGVWGP
jgi:hypothetical protein